MQQLNWLTNKSGPKLSRILNPVLLWLIKAGKHDQNKYEMALNFKAKFSNMKLVRTQTKEMRQIPEEEAEKQSDLYRNQTSSNV